MKKKRILRDRPLITCSRVVLFTVGSEHKKVLQMSIFARASFDKT